MITVSDKPKVTQDQNTKSPLPPLPRSAADSLQNEPVGAANVRTNTSENVVDPTDDRSQPPTAWNAGTSSKMPRKKLALPVPGLRGNTSTKTSTQRHISPGSTGDSSASPRSPTGKSIISASIASRSTGTSLRPQSINPRMHNRASIMVEAHAIEDDESRRLSELAFLD